MPELLNLVGEDRIYVVWQDHAKIKNASTALSVSGASIPLGEPRWALRWPVVTMNIHYQLFHFAHGFHAWKNTMISILKIILAYLKVEVSPVGHTCNSLVICQCFMDTQADAERHVPKYLL